MKRFNLATLVALIAITAMVITACNKKSDTQSAGEVTTGSHSEMLGDTSALIGKWHIRDRVNCGEEQHYYFNADGSYTNSFPYRPSENGTWNLNGNILTTQYQEAAMDGIGGNVTVSFQLIIKNPDNINLIYQNDSVIELTRCNIAGEAAVATSSNRYAKILSGDFSAFAGTWVTGEGRTNPLGANGVFGNGNAYNFKEIDSGYFEWIVNWGGGAGEVQIRLYPVGVEVYNTWTGSHIQTNTAKDRITVMDVVRNDEVYYQPDYHVQFKGETVYMTFTLLPQMSGNTKIGDILTYLNFAYEDKQHQIDLEYLGPISYTGPGSVNISAGDYNSDGFMDLTINGVIIHYNSQTKSYPMPNDPYAGFSPQGVQ